MCLQKISNFLYVNSKFDCILHFWKLRLNRAFTWPICVIYRTKLLRLLYKTKNKSSSFSYWQQYYKLILIFNNLFIKPRIIVILFELFIFRLNFSSVYFHTYIHVLCKNELQGNISTGIFSQLLFKIHIFLTSYKH